MPFDTIPSSCSSVKEKSNSPYSFKTANSFLDMLSFSFFENKCIKNNLLPFFIETMARVPSLFPVLRFPLAMRFFTKLPDKFASISPAKISLAAPTSAASLITSFLATSTKLEAR
nr:hypothetical protein [Rahnella sp. WMR114]